MRSGGRAFLKFSVENISGLGGGCIFNYTWEFKIRLWANIINGTYG